MLLFSLDSVKPLSSKIQGSYWPSQWHETSVRTECKNAPGNRIAAGVFLWFRWLPAKYRPRHSTCYCRLTLASYRKVVGWVLGDLKRDFFFLVDDIAEQVFLPVHFSPCAFIKYHSMKVYAVVGYSVTYFQLSVVDKSQWWV